jgi:hypothetical protein
VLITVDHLKKGGFAVSVLSDQADTLFGAQREIDFVKDEPIPEAFGQIFYPDHEIVYLQMGPFMTPCQILIGGILPIEFFAIVCSFSRPGYHQWRLLSS